KVQISGGRFGNLKIETCNLKPRFSAQSTPAWCWPRVRRARLRRESRAICRRARQRSEVDTRRCKACEDPQRLPRISGKDRRGGESRASVRRYDRQAIADACAPPCTSR